MKKLLILLSLMLFASEAWAQSTKARTFNGSSDILTSASALINTGATTVTYGFQYYDPSAQSTDVPIWNHGYEGSGNGPKMLSNWSGSAGTDLVYWGAGGGVYIISFPRPTTDAFHYYEIQITPSGSNAGQLEGIFSIKVDGASKTITKVADTGPTTIWTNNTFTFGGDGSSFSAGRVSDIAIWNTSQGLTSCTDPGTEGTAIYYWPINQTSPEVPTIGAINLNVTGTSNSTGACSAPPSVGHSNLLLLGVGQ